MNCEMVFLMNGGRKEHRAIAEALRMRQRILVDDDGTVGETYGVYGVNHNDMKRDDYKNLHRALGISHQRRWHHSRLLAFLTAARFARRLKRCSAFCVCAAQRLEVLKVSTYGERSGAFG
jgi:hypothetical protein